MSEYLSKPDGHILEFLKDPRVWATALGATLEAFLEKQIFPMNRGLFGYTAEAGGTVIFVTKDVFENSKTFGVAADNSQIKMNRQLARAAMVGIFVAIIEFSRSGDPKMIANLQYVCLGGASVAIAHLLQDFFPALQMSAKTPKPTTK
jgi:hypothetical protein